MKLGVASVPPVFFAGTRFVVAGLVMLLLAGLRGEVRRLDRRELSRLVLVQLLMVVLTYAPLFWGIRYVPSGLTAVLDLALMPVSLLGFGIALGEEYWSSGRTAALGFGFAGLAVLFGPQIVVPTDPLSLIGRGRPKSIRKPVAEIISSFAPRSDRARQRSGSSPAMRISDVQTTAWTAGMRN
jgi:drug/metabolite transporter (DMT)-like permease